MNRISLAILAALAAPHEQSIESAWLAFQGPPLARAAIGCLQGPQPGQNDFEVEWISTGATTIEKEGSLLTTPLEWMIPEIGPNRFPAVFARHAHLALVWGKNGWGWVSAQAHHYFSFDERLNSLREGMETDIKTGTNADGYTYHHGFLIHLEKQALRSAPRDDARVIGRLPESLPYWEAVWPAGPQIHDSRPPPPLRDLSVLAQVGELKEIPIRIHERRGDWARVSLPGPPKILLAHPPENKATDALLISWSAKPAGWVRLSKPGLPKGTSVMVWSEKLWGIASVTY